MIADLAKISAHHVHLAIGVFDGVHLGHQAVIKSAHDAAQATGGYVVVLTFDPHPIWILAPEKAPRRILASREHKRKLLQQMGAHSVIIIDFTREFSELSPVDFLTEILSSVKNLKSISVGENWHFGKDAQGDIGVLEKFAQEHGMKAYPVPIVLYDGKRVSSTLVRQAIREGRLGQVKKLLGRDYTIYGTVIEGRRIGSKIGFPTANLRVYNEQLPPDGVWAVKVSLENGEIYFGAANLGIRPSIEDANPKRILEVHLLDFQGNLYGLNMELCFVKHLREEKRFSSIEALKKQIIADIVQCREILKAKH